MRKILCTVALAIGLSLVPGTGHALCQKQPVEFLMTTWCPYCREQHAFLTKHGIAFKEIDVERTADPIARMIGKTVGVPYTIIGTIEIEGFDEAKLKQALCIK